MEGIEYMDQKSCHSLHFVAILSETLQIQIVSHSEPKVQKIKSIDAFNLSIYL